MKSQAVLCRELNQPVVVETIEVAPPQSGEVMIKLAACAPPTPRAGRWACSRAAA